MGTTLTGTTPQDTYDSLIKVTDNGPLTGSLKKLTDGLGNDSSLSLSTAAASIAGTLAVTTGTTLATTSGNVGIGVLPSTPVYKLQINASGGQGISLLGDVDNEAFVLFGDSASAVVGRLVYSNIDDSMQMFTNGSEKVRITSAGVLSLNQGQIQFPATQVASANANTLDDYEEGTWTPSFRGTTTAGTYTYSSVQAGAYTKIGNQVTVWCSLIGITASSAGTGEWLVAGLPFTIANNDSMSRNNTTAWIRLANASRSNILALPSQGGGGVAFVYDANSVGNTDFTIASDFQDGLQIGFSFTYFV